MKNKEIKERWKSYFEKLLNKKHLDNVGEEKSDSCDETRENKFYQRIRKFEEEITLKKIKSGNTVGPDGIPIEVEKCLGNLGVGWIKKLFNRILMTKRMHDG